MMAESKFTKGPWKTARGFGTSPPIVLPILIVEGQDGRYRNLAIIVPAGAESEEDIANAAIMSRAPQMFGFLLDAEKLLRAIDSTKHKRLVKKIRALIVDIQGE
jgi:hypothetical protein